MVQGELVSSSCILQLILDDGHRFSFFWVLSLSILSLSICVMGILDNGSVGTWCVKRCVLATLVGMQGQGAGLPSALMKLRVW